MNFIKLARIRSCSLIAFGWMILLAGCNSTLGHFDVSEPLPESRIEGGAVSGFLPNILPPLALDVTASESYQREDYDYLTSIQLDSLTLTIAESSTDSREDTLEDGNPDNFDFLDAISIYIEAEFDGATQRTLVGEIAENDTQLSSSLSTIQFTMTGVDILQYVESPQGYTISIEIAGVAPPDAVIFGGVSNYRVGFGFR